MRFANSAISLNTNEHLIRLEIGAGSGRKRASYEMITDLNQLEEMKRGIDIAVEMLDHVQPLEYDPTVPRFTETFADESGYDPELAAMTGEEKLACFNQAVAGLETEQLRLSGIFSSGINIVAQINTTSEHTQFFCTTDAQMTVVLAHEQDKWEVQSERSAQRKADLDPAAMRKELAFLVERFTTDPTQQVPLGRYDIVFGPAATADLISIMGWVGFNGGTMMRGYSFLTEEQVGKQVFSPQFSLVDDASRQETFPFRRDYYGMPRAEFPIFTDGVFQAFTWEQDEADEFGKQATGHTVHHNSLVLKGGEEDVASLEALAAKPRQNDLLYVPFLHYMNLVNPSRGVVTASSRFGALLLKADGTTVIPYQLPPDPERAGYLWREGRLDVKADHAV